jgi:hypothetical protein
MQLELHTHRALRDSPHPESAFCLTITKTRELTHTFASPEPRLPAPEKPNTSLIFGPTLVSINVLLSSDELLTGS